MEKTDWFTASVHDIDFLTFVQQGVDNKGLKPFIAPSSKVVCVGRNYVEHAKELNNPVPKSPILFIKPNSALVKIDQTILIPTHSECHHELEIAILIGKKISHIKPDDARHAIAGIGLALDLTLREVQGNLKKSGHPWEIAKAFDGACPVTAFIPYSSEWALDNITFSMKKNNSVVQQGNSKQMIFDIENLVSRISNHFTLLPGDIVLTGTPAGVSALDKGDELELYLEEKLLASCVVKSEHHN